MVDYSKWKKIEISDDEDDTHPNIDTGSLFRWRHDARLQRMAEHEKSKTELEQQLDELNRQLKLLDLKIDDAHKQQPSEIDEIVKQRSDLLAKKQDLEKRERLQPWNVDTISKDSWSKTVLNKKCLEQLKSNKQGLMEENYDVDDPESESFDQNEANSYISFVEKHEKAIKKLAFHSRFDDCRRYLLDHPDLVNKHTVDYLSLWCVQLHLDKKKFLLDHVAKQTVILQMIFDLSKTGKNIDPRSCLPSFFNKAKEHHAKFEKLFEEEFISFKERVAQAAEMRIERAIKEQEDKQERLIGPGGLDAQEVFESLPPQLQQCFESRDVELLEKTLMEMKSEEAEFHMKRCIDAGLWVTKKSNNDNDENEKDEQLYQKLLEKNSGQCSFIEVSSDEDSQ